MLDQAQNRKTSSNCQATYEKELCLLFEKNCHKKKKKLNEKKKKKNAQAFLIKNHLYMLDQAQN